MVGYNYVFIYDENSVCIMKISIVLRWGKVKTRELYSKTSLKAIRYGLQKHSEKEKGVTGRFGTNPFRPLDVLAPRRFGPRHFGPSRFGTKSA